MPKIASIERIVSVTKHPGADSLDLVRVLGFQCVTQIGLYKEGELIVFIQPDSILPEVEWAEGYRKYSPKRIKACKLRGEWSEGIIVPLGVYENIVIESDKVNRSDDGLKLPMFIHVVGTDVAEIMGIEHYVPPAPQEKGAVGPLPFGIPKTDQERWENLKTLPFDEPVDVTLKIDGQSVSFAYDLESDSIRAMGRTLEYELTGDNKLTRIIAKYDLEAKLRAYGRKHQISFALRGEYYGRGVQTHGKNPHAQLNNDVAFFSVFLTKKREYATYGQEHYFINVCQELDLPIVPTMPQVLTPELIRHFSIEATEVEGKPFEGVVINHGPYVVARIIELPGGDTKTVLDPVRSGSFKVINKPYDSKK